MISLKSFFVPIGYGRWCTKLCERHVEIYIKRIKTMIQLSLGLLSLSLFYFKINLYDLIIIDFFQLFQPYYSSIADHERMRSIEATLLVLNIYFDAATDFSLEVIF